MVHRQANDPSANEESNYRGNNVRGLNWIGGSNTCSEPRGLLARVAALAASGIAFNRFVREDLRINACLPTDRIESTCTLKLLFIRKPLSFHSEPKLL